MFNDIRIGVNFIEKFHVRPIKKRFYIKSVSYRSFKDKKDKFIRIFNVMQSKTLPFKFKFKEKFLGSLK